MNILDARIEGTRICVYRSCDDIAAFARCANARTITLDASFWIVCGQTKIAIHTFIAKLSVHVQLQFRRPKEMMFVTHLQNIQHIPIIELTLH